MSIAIGELGRRSGVKVPTIRYYEQIGLLRQPARTEGQQRRYEAGTWHGCRSSATLVSWASRWRRSGPSSSFRISQTNHAPSQTRSPKLASWKSSIALPASLPCRRSCRR